MIWAWLGFIFFIFALLALDLGLLNRRSRAIPIRQALVWSLLWVAISLAFAAVIYDGYAHQRFGLGTTADPVDGRVNDGPAAAAKYLTGYVLEKALSVDNLFVIAVIFRFLAVPAEYQHRVLFWGILGAMMLRGLLIGVGAGLVSHHHWVLYLVGAFLLFTGARLLLTGDDPPDPARDPVLRISRRLLPLTPRYHGGRFIAIENGRRMFTPLALSLLLVETADVVFATDSIPAVFAVTADPLLVFTSNILAVLGLRALYFALAGLMEKFRHLKVWLALVLILVGAKIMAGDRIKLLLGEYGSLYLLGGVIVLIGAGIALSALLPEPAPSQPHTRTKLPDESAVP